ncbi:hypothetical protein EJ04DRAFT_484853 [Polyplosphaeria fusca]|uniref:CHAT domain-containing protein n=1 Tax=Polyplosphaeria fusca TaxID=682080 RepID=A0A9P4R8U9_9PLEO|nr:hypothetical protein EJ04DRAFT_484853 [Polyplosphaeria fusca]
MTVPAYKHDPEEVAEELNKEYVKHKEQYNQNSDLSILKTALDCITRAVEQTAGEAFAKSSVRAGHLTNLGRCQGLLFDATGDGKHLDESLNAIKLSVQTAPDSSNVRPLCLINYSDVLARRYFSRGDKQDLEEALHQARIAVTAASEGSAHWGSAQSTLASRLAQHFEYIEQDDRYMNEAIAISQELVAKTSADDELYAVHIFNLAGDLQNRYLRYGDLKDLRSAKDLFARAKDSFPTGNLNHSSAVRQYAGTVHDMVDRTGESDELESAIQALVALEPKIQNPQELSKLFHQKSRLYALRYQLFSNSDDIDQSVVAAVEALRNTTQSSSIRYIILQRLSNSLASRAELRMSQEDIDSAIDYARQGAENASGISVQESAALNTMATRLLTKFELFGGTQTLKEALKANFRSMDILPKDHKDRPMKLHAAAICLRAHFEFYGQVHFLDESIAMEREAADSLPVEHPDRGMPLDGLSHSLSVRSKLTGNFQDLNEAIVASEAAVQSCPPGRKDRPAYLNGLANRLDSRADRMKSNEDLDKAIAAITEAIDSCAEGSSGEPIYLFTLSNCFAARFNMFGDASGLDKSVETLRNCLGKVSATNPMRLKILNNLGLRLQQLYTKADEQEDKRRYIEESLKHATECIDQTPEDHPSLPGYLQQLGISSLACASFVALGKPDKALEVLEAGRGIMANIAMGYHADLSNVRAADPKLHTEYTAVRDRLSQPLPESEGKSHADDAVAKRNADLAAFESLETQIRNLPGLESFNESMTADKMKSLAVFGPVVAFCTVHQRCDALIVTQDGIEALPLPDLKEEDIKARLGLVVGKDRLSKMPPTKRGIANKKMRALLEWLWDKAVQPVLQHLGLTGDGTLTSSDKKRLWWVTSGPLGLMPLHAAGKGDKKPSQNTYSRIISSYVPSFSSLSFARTCEAKVDTASPAMALITMPLTPGGLNPLSTAAESHAIHEAFSTSNPSHTALYELCQPSAAQVVALVSDSSIDMLHLACHAEPNLDDPSSTALLFGSDASAAEPDTLPISKLRNLHAAPVTERRPPRLAYLSACCTAQQYDLRLIDENIHLASAFQLCGFPGVIGTLWEADDGAAVVVAREFYLELLRLDRGGGGERGSGERIARALDWAVGVYRGSKVGRSKAVMDVLAWASFVHIGA